MEYLDKIINETLCNVSIDRLLRIKRFGKDFEMGGYWYSLFYVKVGEKV